MKRKISIVLALIIMLTSIPFNSFAEENYDKQLKEAIIRSKNLFNIGSEYDKFTQSISSMDGKTVFYLNWSANKDEVGQVNVSITMDGDVLSYGKWVPMYGEQEIEVPNINKEEGLKIAKSFIEKVSPKLAGNIKYMDTLEHLSIGSNNYRYNFVRVENEIPYYNNNIDIYVNNSTGEITDYYINWNIDLEFIDTKDIITVEKAKELYKEKIGLDLIYKEGYEDGEAKTFLVYGPLNKEIGINAKDGEIIPLYGDYRLYDRTADVGGAGDEHEKQELSPDEEKAIDNIAGLISEDEAEKVARNILGLDKEYKLGSINLYTSWRNDDEYNWDMNFDKELENISSFANISINAKTKKLLSFYNNTLINENSKVLLNNEQALNLAKEFIKKFNQEDYDKIELVENPGDIGYLKDKQRHSFQFIRKIDNAYVEQDGIFITIDAVNKKVEQYTLTWSNKSFPSKNNVIAIDKAYSILFNDIEIELKYAPKNMFDIYDNKPMEKKEAILVYGLKTNKPANIDANTGIILDNAGKAYKESRVIEYKDIEGSYAKDKINALAQYGIALAGEEFKPKSKIIQKDFLYLLAKAKYYYYGIDDSEEELYKQLINNGVLKESEKAPNKVVTKEEAIKYFIKSLGYEKVAELKGIYKDIFNDTKDINPELKGHISIAYGLGIVKGDNKNLYPKAELKREDAANMIYNLLFKDN